MSELCRVASDSVIIDYPTWLSVNFLSPVTFALKKKLEGNTRTFKLFSGFDIQREFRRHGFYPAGKRKQFLFPMALHRALDSQGVSSRLETAARVVGLTSLFGSPVIARFDRR